MQEFRRPVPAASSQRLFGGASPGASGEVRCPRCESANTKFCYYNNYNLAQPRHFCRACRRYWTKGGLLRNVPVGGGCRKPKPKTRRPAAAADHAGKNGAHRDAKNARSGTSTDGAPDSSPVAARPSCRSSSSCVTEASAGTGLSAAGGALPLPLPAPMFADQAAAFASLMAASTPLPAFGFSAQPKADGRAATALSEQPSAPPPSTATAAEFAAQSAGATDDWAPSAADAGILELSGGILAGGDEPLPSYYWNHGSWSTDSDATMYQL
ncbi:hypothetical protein ACP70R_047208 [Stipagrostis hirtigluma subsp. patula]